MNFLIAYHRPSATMKLWEFDNSDVAMQTRFYLEQARPSNNWEIAVLHAKDLATIQQTHSRYFTGQWSAESSPESLGTPDSQG